jgi:16S rRNA (cytidine1402-2'-O)-methyltransferase
VPGTLILFESPRRIGRLLTELAQRWDATREAALCRELTKRFEEVQRGTLEALAADCVGRQVRGEVVLLVDRASGKTSTGEQDRTEMENSLRNRLKTHSLKEAVALVAGETGLPRRQVYQAALRLERGQ